MLVITIIIKVLSELFSVNKDDRKRIHRVGEGSLCTAEYDAAMDRRGADDRVDGPEHTVPRGRGRHRRTRSVSVHLWETSRTGKSTETEVSQWNREREGEGGE